MSNYASGKKRLHITLNSPVILAFTGLCLLALVLDKLTLGLTNQVMFSTYHSSLSSPMTYVRFFTHVLGHSGWDHFIGNMGYILILGPLLEEKYGPKILFMIIAVTALVTGVLTYVLFPQVMLLGASGVVFAFILLSSITSFKDGEIPVTFILVAVIYLGQQVYQGLFFVDNVSNFGHVIGGIAGSVSGFVLGRRSR